MKQTIDGIEYCFEDSDLLEEALTHRSIGSFNNERLEFLGDSVLNMVVAARLFERFPKSSEGEMSRMRARLVRGATLAEIAAEIGLGRQVAMGGGELKSGGFRRASILADTFEAVLGAIFLDGGFSACRDVILGFFDPLIEELPRADQLKDAKTRLQEWLQGKGRPLPAYALIYEEGADHCKTFHVSCRLDDDGMESKESGDSRRKAEQAAAAAMLELLQASGS